MDLKHPIFRLPEDPRTNFIPQNLLGEGRLNFDLLCSRNEDELFLVTQRSIRACNIHSSRYKLLQLSEPIEFEPVKAFLNSSGTLMALHGAKNLMLVSLPSSKAVSSVSDTMLLAKSHVVGDFEASIILKVLFNEVSKSESNVTVLASDGYVRSFDVNVSPEIPFHVLHLNEKAKPNRLGYRDSIDATSISFGSSMNAVGSLSLYINTEMGDVYTIFPFFPSILSVPLSFLEQLIGHTVKLAKSRPESVESLAQLKLVSQMLRNKEKFPVEFKMNLRTGLVEKHYVIRVNPDLINSMELQGPLIVSKFPEELYKDDGLDICYVNSQDRIVLASTWSSGSILIMEQQEDLSMKWSKENIKDGRVPGDRSVLTVIAQFKTLGKCRMFPFYDSVLVQGSSTQLLTVNEKEPKLIELYSDHRSDLSDTILGVAQLTGFNDGNKAIVLKPQTVECITLPTTISIAPTISDLGEDGFKPTEGFIGMVHNENFLLNTPFQEVQLFLESVKQRNFKCLQTTAVGSFTFDEATLIEMRELGNKALHRILALNKLSLMLLRRIALQRKEFKNQIRKFVQIKERQRLSSDSNPIRGILFQYSDRLERIQSKCSDIGSSLAALLYTLGETKRKSLPVSAAEKSYFRELNIVKAKVVGKGDGIQSQIEFLVNQVEYLRRKANPHNNKTNSSSILIPTFEGMLTNNHRLDLESWKNIKERLARNELKSREARQLLSKQLQLVNEKLTVLDLQKSI